MRENNEISDTTTVYNYYDNGNLRFKSEMEYTDVDLDLRPHVTDEYYESAPFCGQTICGTSVCAEKTQLHIHTEELAGKTPIRYDYDYLNRLTMINGEVIAEYANDCDLGKPTKYKGKQLSWDGNKLTSVAKNGKVRTFNYDVRNYLVSAVTDGDTSKFFYDEKGNLLREERTKNGVNYKVNYIYAGGEAIGFTLRGQWKIDLDGAKAQDFPFYYVKDAQGNVRKIVDRMGNCVVKYNYNAWGKETVTPVESTWEFPLELNSDGTVKKFCQASDIAELNRLTYRGYFYNREIGLYYLINRYYDPETGRFISADDAEYLDFQTLYGSNRYIYCLNNPVNYIDPEGQSLVLLGILAIGTAIGIILGAVDAYKKGKTGWDFVKEVLLAGAMGLAATAAAMLTFGVFAGAIYGATYVTFLGVTAYQMFAVGTVAFNIVAVGIAPLFGLEMESIDYDGPSPVDGVNPPTKSPRHPSEKGVKKI